MKYWRKVMLLAFLLLAVSWAVPVKAGNMYYTVDSVNIRKKATKKSKVVKVVPRNTMVKKLDVKKNWYKVSWNGKSGYIRKDLLREYTVPKTKVNASDVNLRKKANGKVIRLLSKWEKVRVISTSNGWSRVKTSDGTIGYVFTKYLGDGKGKSRKQLISKWKKAAVKYAKKHLGDKYSQTKRDMKGYKDCSSLVRDAYRSASKQFIGDTTDGQYDYMKKYFYKIKHVEDLKYGDLVYHLTGDNHTGIYIGDGKIIHASQTAGKVKVSEYDNSSTYWEYGCRAAAYCYDIKVKLAEQAD